MMDDSMREVTGEAEASNPKEVNRIIQELKEAGVEIIRRENAMGYSPSVAAGKPGQFYIEKGASYSAWCHEFKHFSDDRDDGYLGFRVFQDIQKCKQREIDAYQIEIELARKANREDVVKRLEELRDRGVLSMSDIQFNIDNMHNGSTVAILNGISSISSVEVLNAIVAGTRLKIKDKLFVQGLVKAMDNEEVLMGIPIKDFAMASLDILNIQKYSGNSVRVREMIQCGLEF